MDKDIPDYIKKRYWKDYLPAGITLDLKIPEISLGELFEQGAKNFGNKVAMVYYDHESNNNHDRQSREHKSSDRSYPVSY